LFFALLACPSRREAAVIQILFEEPAAQVQREVPSSTDCRNGCTLVRMGSKDAPKRETKKKPQPKPKPAPGRPRTGGA
jgi:hypothetical protein